MINPEFFTALSEFVFLDTGRCDHGPARSFLFAQPVKHIIAWNTQEVPHALEMIDQLSEDFWLAGYVRYEASFGLIYKLPSLNIDSGRPLIWFGVYEKPSVVRRIDQRDYFSPLIRLNPQIKFSDYASVVKTIKQHIYDGNTYQVNYTFDIDVAAESSPENLYFFLRQHQKTPYNAFIRNSTEEILSFSPELFFKREGLKIMTRPMKGTAPRRSHPEDDAFEKINLGQDVKNQAENLMIVDLLRNDLGRICQAGSVRVPLLFDVETHPTVHQMTSVVQGSLKEHIEYADIFKALFPCGSVTGAPKLKTMEIISQVEGGCRGVYCGAIGYIAPGKKAVFSVPIRILQKERAANNWQYRVGSGVVWDSGIRKEWEEVKVKTSFLLKNAPNDFELVETMSWDGLEFSYQHEHFFRLIKSARFFKFPINDDGLKRYLKGFQKDLPCKKGIIRLLLNKDGKLRGEFREIEKGERECIVRVSTQVLDSRNVFLQHKTTYRPWYQKTATQIKQGSLWDELFFNQRGELCEGSRTNIFVQKMGALFTPPTASGLLPGIFRQKLLDDKQCVEKTLYAKDIMNADAIYCGNSVRGLQQVFLTRV